MIRAYPTRPLKLLAVLVLALHGCDSAGRLVETTGDKARTFVGGIEPTGVVSDTSERKKLMVSSRTLVESVDAEAFNRAVTEWATAAARLSERLDAVSTDDLRATSLDLAESVSALRSQLEALHLDQALDSLQSLTASAERQLSLLDVESANAVLQESKIAAAQLSGTVAEFERASAELFPRSADRIERVLGTLEFVLRLVAGATMVLILCLLAWFYRLVRPSPAPRDGMRA